MALHVGSAEQQMATVVTVSAQLLLVMSPQPALQKVSQVHCIWLRKAAVVLCTAQVHFLLLKHKDTWCTMVVQLHC